MRAARSGEVPDGLERVTGPTPKTTRRLQLLAAVCWHLSRRTSDGTFTLGIVQAARAMRAKKSSVARWLRLLMGPDAVARRPGDPPAVIVRTRIGNSVDRLVSSYVWVGVPE